MSELRKDPIVNRWVIIADDPLRSPEVSMGAQETVPDDPCPFCPGNEHLCPPEILANRESGSFPNDARWALRVIPNRSPLLVVEEDLKRMGEGVYDKITGVGANEVIIETNRHGIRQADMTARELENMFWAYRDRIIDLKRDSRIQYVQIYKNCGASAGASLSHGYSLLMALPIVPRLISDEIEGSKRHFENKQRCIYCDVIRQEIQLETRIVSETKMFVAIEPFAPRVPFETWILPKRHCARFDEIEPRELSDMALIFKDVFSRLDIALNSPAYNYIIHTSPSGNNNEEFYHWHMEIFPRIKIKTGFEWGTDLYINCTPPEASAAFLRGLVV
ncbi:MAG TPA: galactose-1-phosphate uridylyltransferase [Deltaproteobacteria bacterium]|nr:galactose-1-phosphate uridylyltransferase [Deltaproteobacteria bacterium]